MRRKIIQLLDKWIEHEEKESDEAYDRSDVQSEASHDSMRVILLAIRDFIARHR